MARSLERVAIVGASLAGLSAAHALRRHGFRGTLALVGAETHRPYQRPPLSKQLLAGTWDHTRTALRVEEGLDAQWRLGTRARALDLTRRQVELDDGERLAFDGLVIATGAHARWPRGIARLEGVHTLRTLDDCARIRETIDRGARRITVLGAGFIGSEVAATFRKLELDVTLVDLEEVPMERILGPELGRICLELHRENGVRLAMGTPVSGLEGDERVEAVRLADGRRIETDLVVAGVGVVPTVDWLEGSGLRLADGVVCDATCTAIGADGTPVEGIVAAGDVARWENERFGHAMRIEHWDNAIAQGEAAARTLLALPGEAPSYRAVPFFWSDQYGHKLQMAGAPRRDDEVRIVEGSAESRRFVAVFVRDARIVAAFALNGMHRIAFYRRLVEERQTIDELSGTLLGAAR